MTISFTEQQGHGEGISLERMYSEIEQELQGDFPNARLGVIDLTFNAQGEITRAFDRNEDRPVYFASTIKPLFAIAAARVAKAAGHGLEDKVVPLTVTEDMLDEVRQDAELSERRARGEKVHLPYMQEMLEDAEIDPSTLSETNIGEQHMVSLHSALRAAVGPSSNVVLGYLLNYISQNNPGEKPKDYMQKLVTRWLGAESLLTVNGSYKEKRSQLWNAGKLSEILWIFQMIMDESKRLGISPEAMKTIKNRMNETFSEPNIELSQRVEDPEARGIAQIGGKSGDFQNLDMEIINPGNDNSMPVLMAANGWDSSMGNKVTYIMTTERVKYRDGTYRDLAISIGIPYLDAFGDDETARATYILEQKKRATDIVMGRIAQSL